MQRAMIVILICVASIPALSQSTDKYQEGAIIAVQPHKSAEGSDTSTASYDVSLKVGNEAYVVLYTPPFGIETVRYATGRQLLVLVGEKTITFNDELGTSSELPILSQKPIVVIPPSSSTNAKVAEKFGRPVFVETSPTNAVQSSSPASVTPPQRLPVKSTEVIGLADVKERTEGTLTIENGKLCFAHAGAKSDIAAAGIEDVVTGDDSQRVIRGTLGTLTTFGPYGSGRVVSMFRSKVDSLTIQYQDANGGLHGVIFTMPAGTAESFKQELLAQGAHTTIPAPAGASVGSSHAVTTEVKP